MERPACRMRRVFSDSEEAPRWPEGVSIRTLRGEADAKTAYKLLQSTYEEGGDELPPFGMWWGRLSKDEEFDADLFFLALDQGGTLAGVAQCWTSGFMKDLAVRLDMRSGGLGEALLRHAFAEFKERGLSHLDLKVEIANESAMRLYERVGMVRVSWEG
jgi:ribosomal protein S18 acetylase RimI-like enzyme